MLGHDVDQRTEVRVQDPLDELRPFVAMLGQGLGEAGEPGDVGDPHTSEELPRARVGDAGSSLEEMVPHQLGHVGSEQVGNSS